MFVKISTFFLIVVTSILPFVSCHLKKAIYSSQNPAFESRLNGSQNENIKTEDQSSNDSVVNIYR